MELIINHSNRNYKIDQGRITLLDSRFYFNDLNQPVPSVTTILDGAYPKGAAFFEWLKKNGQDSDEIRDEAGRKGSNVHHMTEAYDKGQEVTLLTPSGDIGMTLNEWAQFERYVDFATRFKPEIEKIEQTLVGEKYAGTLDRIVKINGKRYIVDIKTSGAVYNHYWLQLGAYASLIKELWGFEIDGLAVLWLNAKTKTEGKKDAMQGKGWQFIAADKSWQELHSVFTKVYDLWMEENGSMVPRQVSYQLTHKK